MWETYFTPATLDEAIQLLAEYKEAARIIAGGTDIIIELERKLRPNVHCLIDITRIPGLDEILLGEDGLIHLGPLVTHNHAAGSSLLRKSALPLVQASWSEAAPQIRNRATIAGNVITASPANDTISPLMALNAQVTLHSVLGTRVVPLHEFYQGVRKTAMRANEILTDISFAPMLENERGIFLKLGLRRAQAISVVNLTAILRFDGEVIADARITQGSVAPTIIFSSDAEKLLIGEQLSDDVISQAAELAVQAATPIDDVRGSAEYRLEMVRILTKRALTALKNHTESEGLPESPIMLWGQYEGRVVAPLIKGFRHNRDDVIETTVNQQTLRVQGGTQKTLLRWLRENVGMTGTKEGCAEGECGACTVFLDGAAVMSCMVAAPRAHHAVITTVEGLAQNGNLHPIQQGFVEQAAVQCGYCTPGFLMAGAKLLEERENPSRWNIQQSITGNLCRCTGYYTIVSAFERAAELMTQEEKYDTELR